MQKVDLVIAGVGVLAVIATTLGVVFYEEAAGERQIVFPESPASLTQSDSGNAGTFTFTFTAPDNATAFEDLQVTVDFTGTAGVNPSGGSYEVRVTAPDGSSCTGQTQSWSENEVTIDVPDCRWADAPEPTSGADAASADEGVSWEDDLLVEVVVTNPQATNVPNVHTYSYDVDVQLRLLTYAAQVETPDPQGAQ